MEQFDNRNSSFASIEDKSKNAGKMKIKNKENKPPKIFQLKCFFFAIAITNSQRETETEMSIKFVNCLIQDCLIKCLFWYGQK